MDQLTQLRTEFEAAIQALRNENQFIKNQLDQFTQSAKPTRPKPSLPEPEKFSGQSLKFDTWLPAIKAKLRIDGAAIGDASAQFYYVYLNLDSSVQAMVLPQLNYAEENADWNYQVILDQLTRVYDNPNKIQEAEDRLLSLKQGDDNLTTYVAKFERILYESRSQTWPDAFKISAFRRGLGPTIKNRLIQQLNLPKDYPGFLRVVQQLAGHSNQSQPHSQPTASKPPVRFSDSMDITAINMVETTFNDYRSQGLCFRCGSSEHWVKNCPNSPPGGVLISTLSKPSPGKKLWNYEMLKSLETQSDTSLDDY
jgi:hypothetical protein